MLRHFVYIFIIAFLLNAIWEFSHAVLYNHYADGAVYDFMLFRATLFDAFIITFFAYPFIARTYLRNKLWVMVSLLTIFAVGLELWALETGRWAYTAGMPIIPFIQVGLTPTVQLGLTAYISVRAALWLSKRN